MCPCLSNPLSIQTKWKKNKIRNLRMISKLSLKNEWEFRKWAHFLIHSFIKPVLSTYSVSKFWRNTDESNVALKKLTF